MIIAFDSGTFTGWATCIDGLIVKCGLITVAKDKPMNSLPYASGGLIVIEKPIHRRHGKTVDPNDLISLGIKVGRLKETYLVLGNRVREILPTDWKGSVPKEIQNARDRDQLHRSELDVVLTAMLSIAPSYQNNVWDAIGIALWTAKKEGERK